MIILLLLTLILIAESSFGDDIQLDSSVKVRHMTYGKFKPSVITVSDPTKNIFDYELPEWRHDDSTILLEEACGIPFESHLLGGTKRNYVYVYFKNTSEHRIAIESNKVRMLIGERYDGNPIYKDDYPEFLDIGKGNSVSIFVPMPTKYLMKGAEKVEIDIPFSFENQTEKKNCTFKTSFTRFEAELARSVAEYSSIDVSFGIGAALLKTGGLGKISNGTGGVSNFSLYLYPWPIHGIYFAVLADAGYRRGDHNAMRSVTGYSQNEEPRLSSSNIAFGYSHKFILNYKWRATYDIGIGKTFFEHTTASRVEKKYRANSFEQKITLDYQISRIDLGGENGLHYLGLMLHHYYLPSARLDDISARGNAFGMLLAYKFGI